jgi:hypothetical protein
MFAQKFSVTVNSPTLAGKAIVTAVLVTMKTLMNAEMAEAIFAFAALTTGKAATLMTSAVGTIALTTKANGEIGMVNADRWNRSLGQRR